MFPWLPGAGPGQASPCKGSLSGAGGAELKGLGPVQAWRAMSPPLRRAEGGAGPSQVLCSDWGLRHLE